MRGKSFARSSSPLTRRTFGALSPLLLAGCFSPGEGLAPPATQVYFPVGLAQNSDGTRLFVVNSDFDLQFNAGTLQTYDLTRMAEVVPKVCVSNADCAAGQRCDLEPSVENLGSASRFCVAEGGAFAGRPCGAVGDRPPADKLLYPGRCGFIEPTAPQDGGSSLIVDAVTIGAFATDVIFRARPADAQQGLPGRLFVPVRGDATLHWIDVDAEGRLFCGQGNNSGACDDRHRSGDDPEQESTRRLRLGPEPFGIDAPVDAGSIVLTNQTTGTASLFVHEWEERGPVLEFAVTGLPSRPIGVASVPQPALAPPPGVTFRPGFLITFRDAPEVRLLRFFDDEGQEDTSPLRPFMVSAGSAPILVNSLGTDSRGIAVDASDRQAAEAACAGDAVCLQGAAAVPLRVFVANRTPASLVVGRTRSAAGNLLGDDLPYFYTSVPLSVGPSRVVAGSIVNAAGQPEQRIFVVCFDSRRIFVYDPATDQIETEITTARGPHALSIDAARGLAYVGHFTDSFIGVINLDQRVPALYGTVIATVGRPTPPRASK